MTNPIRVLIAEDHTIVRQGLARLLSDQPGLNVVGEATNGQKAVAMTERLKPDILIMDIPNYRHLSYRFGVNLVDEVIKGGSLAMGGLRPT